MSFINIDWYLPFVWGQTLKRIVALFCSHNNNLFCCWSCFKSSHGMDFGWFVRVLFGLFCFCCFFILIQKLLICCGWPGSCYAHQTRLEFTKFCLHLLLGLKAQATMSSLTQLTSVSSNFLTRPNFLGFIVSNVRDMHTGFSVFYFNKIYSYH